MPNFLSRHPRLTNESSFAQNLLCSAMPNTQEQNRGKKCWQVGIKIAWGITQSMRSGQELAERVCCHIPFEETHNWNWQTWPENQQESNNGVHWLILWPKHTFQQEFSEPCYAADNSIALNSVSMVWCKLGNVQSGGFLCLGHWNTNLVDQGGQIPARRHIIKVTGKYTLDGQRLAKLKLCTAAWWAQHRSAKLNHCVSRTTKEWKETMSQPFQSNTVIGRWLQQDNWLAGHHRTTMRNGHSTWQTTSQIH